MKTVARALEALRVKFCSVYEHFMLFMTRIGPRSLSHRNDVPFEVLWKPASAHFCPYCDWVYMIWDVLHEQWQCPHCSASCHPPLVITEKRAIVIPPTIFQPKQTTPIPYSVALPEQHAVQPPYTPHVIRSGHLKERFAPGQLGKKFSTGEIEIRDGRPCYKGGGRIDTDQLPYIPKSRRAV